MIASVEAPSSTEGSSGRRSLPAGTARSGRDRADDRAEAPAEAEPGQTVVGAGSDDEAEDDRGDSRGQSRTEPDCQAGQDPDQHGRWLGQAGMRDEGAEGQMAWETEHRRELREEDQDRDRILEAGHHRGGDVPDQSAEPEEPEQGLDDPGEEDDEEGEEEDLGGGRARQAPRDDRGQQEGHEAAGGIHQHVAIAQQQDGERDEDGAVEARPDGHGQVLVPQGLEGQHSVSHAHRDREQGGGDPAHDVPSEAAQVESLRHRLGVDRLIRGSGVGAHRAGYQPEGARRASATTRRHFDRS